MKRCKRSNARWNRDRLAYLDHPLPGLSQLHALDALMAITETPTTMDTLTLGEARRLMTEAIQAVQEAAVDHEEVERDPEQGSYSKSQSYAVLLMRLQQYEDASRVYKQVLAERVRRS